MPAAVPVVMAIGSKIAAGIAAAKTAAAGYIAAQGGAAAVAKGAAVAAGKAVAGAAAGAAASKLINGKEDSSAEAFDENAANRKAATKAAFGARKRIAQQTTTLLTSPVATLGGAAKGAAKTLLGQ